MHFSPSTASSPAASKESLDKSRRLARGGRSGGGGGGTVIQLDNGPATVASDLHSASNPVPESASDKVPAVVGTQKPAKISPSRREAEPPLPVAFPYSIAQREGSGELKGDNRIFLIFLIFGKIGLLVSSR